MRVLVADDASFMRQMIRDIIEPEGFEVVGEAVDGVEVIEKFKELQPDLVMLDIVMPRRSGMDAVRELVELDPTAKVENAIIGPHVSIGENASVKDSIVRDSIISFNAEVSGALLEDSIISDDAHIQGRFQRLNIGDHSEITME